MGAVASAATLRFDSISFRVAPFGARPTTDPPFRNRSHSFSMRQVNVGRMAIDYKQHPILFVDDEPQNLVVFRYALEEQFRVLTAQSGDEALRLLDQHEVAVMLTDQRMPGMTGVELCARARELRPDTIRIIITAYADIHAAISAINLGHVSRYLVKPWRNEELIEVVHDAIEFVHLQQAMRDMELRLLHGGQTRIASAIHDQLLHEIANPLGAMTLTLFEMSETIDSLLRQLDSSERASPAQLPAIRAQLLELRETHGDALAGMSQLNALAARMRAGHRDGRAAHEQCDAGRVVDATLRIIRREVERFATLEIVLEQSPVVRVEASVLGQIVLNLVLNAAQAIEHAGMRDRQIRVTVTSSASHGLLSVADDGPGIDPANLERVFQAYFTTKPSGSGIGLSLVRDMARRAGGQITVHSEPGVQTRFELELPLAKPNSSE
jgi:signal transduction histidine kinase